MRCSYCYCTDKKPVLCRLGFIARFFDNIMQNGVSRGDSIDGVILDLFGGEALSESKLCDQILELFVEKAESYGTQFAGLCREARFFTSTNGLWDEAARQLLLKWKGRLEFSVTLDGCQEMHDANRRDRDGNPTWQRITENLLWARSVPCLKDCTYNTKVTLVPSSYRYLRRMAEELYALGITGVSFNRVMEEAVKDTPETIAEACEALRSLVEFAVEHQDMKFNGLFYQRLGQFIMRKELPDKLHCGYGLTPSLSVDGKVWGCARAMPNSGPSLCLLGDYERFDMEAGKVLRQKFSHHSIACPPKCDDCEFFGYCHECYCACEQDHPENPFTKNISDCMFRRAQMVASIDFKGLTEDITPDEIEIRNKHAMILDDYCERRGLWQTL